MRKVTWVLASIGILSAALGAIVWVRGRGEKGFCMACGTAGAHGVSQCFSAGALLRVLASVQGDFRDQDRDGNGKKDFWREDVAGLYASRAADGSLLRLIPIEDAAADDRPSKPYASLPPRTPVWGCWFRALRHADEAVADPGRFAFCSFPEDYPRHGRFTFIVDEGGGVFLKDLGHGRGVEAYPADPLKEGWTQLD